MTSKSILATALLLALPASAPAQRVMERLDRGTVAVPLGGGKVYVGWRLLATDPEGVAFHLDRSTEGGPAVRLTREPIRDSTNFVDTDAPKDRPFSYVVRPVIGGRSASVAMPGSAATTYGTALVTGIAV